MFRVKQHFQSIGKEDWCNTGVHRHPGVIVSEMKSIMYQRSTEAWKSQLARVNAARGTGHNKLRTYREFKSEYVTEPYVGVTMPWYHRRALAMFRCGTAPLRIETGRYENLTVDQRTCFRCPDAVEDEEHVITVCPLYTDLRNQLYVRCRELSPIFDGMTRREKMYFIMKDAEIAKDSARTLCAILHTRRSALYA